MKRFLLLNPKKLVCGVCGRVCVFLLCVCYWWLGVCVVCLCVEWCECVCVCGVVCVICVWGLCVLCVSCVCGVCE